MSYQIIIYIILNINRKIILVIAFLSMVTSLASLSIPALASIDYSDTPVQESFESTCYGHRCGRKLWRRIKNNGSKQVRNIKAM
jgi:hypothetical protein